MENNASPCCNAPCDVTGQWIGTWWPLASTPESKVCKSIGCHVVRNGDAWQAIFQAECDQSYTFTVAMDGRQAGGAVLFKGATDLGEQGGVFDWIGRADSQVFLGFFTSSYYVGEFRLERKKDAGCSCG
jgi:hypothetical protein